jgi:hypothetical protein
MSKYYKSTRYLLKLYLGISFAFLSKTINMETRQRTASSRMQYLRKLARLRSKFTSVHLMLLVFVFAMAFGGVMKMIRE